MKRLILPTLMLSLSAPAASANWTDDWFASSTSSGASSYKNQQRGFYSAGSYSARFNVSNDPLLTISPPRVSAGCGGVDLFLGGMSMLDPDYLVDKLQNMIQAAPAVAFDTAMKVMSKELSETMKSFEKIINDLNGIQINDCQFAKKLGEPVGDFIGTAASNRLKALDSKAATALGSVTSWYETTENQVAANQEPSVDVKQLTADCPTQFNNIFKTGSLLQNAADEFGFQYVDTMRGFVGDVMINATAAVKAPVIEPISSCPNNDESSIDDFVVGNAEKKVNGAAGPVCQTDSATPGGLLALVSNQMNAIATKIENKTALSAADEAFLTSSPIPILPIIVDSIALGDKAMAIALTEEVVAYAYAFYMVDDLYNTIDNMIREIDAVMNSTGAAGPQCDRTVYAEVADHLTGIKKDAYQFRMAARTSYLKKTQEQMAHIAFTAAQAKRQEEVLRRNAEDITQ